MNKESSIDIEIKKKILEPFEVGKRAIYPIVEVSSFSTGLNMLNVSPIALIVEEDENRYILELTYEKIDEDELFELLSSFKRK